MQIEAGYVRARGASIDAVADDRPSLGSAMHAQLMGATGERLERKPGDVMAFVVAAGRQSRPPHHLPRGHSRLPLGMLLHSRDAGWVIAAEGTGGAELTLRGISG